MKKINLLLFAIFAINIGFSQDLKPHFATIDTVDRADGKVVYEGVFNVDHVNEQYHFDNNHQYWFRVSEANINAAFGTVLNVEFTDPADGKYEKMGDIICSEIHAAATTKDPANNGLYNDAWGFNENIEIWYNGEHIKLVYPALGKSTIKSIEHAFYIVAADYEKMLDAFTPID